MPDAKTTATSVPALVAALQASLAPAPVYWGWVPFESVEMPPSYPILTVHRTLFTCEGLIDMCEDADIVGDTVLAVHAWSPVYADARALMTQARGVLIGLEGWILLGEADLYEPNVRAWQVEGTWQATAVSPD